jgi:predicted metal-dependent peptidase
MAKRLLKHINKSEIDWRTILNEFIQEEINDYSFSPPDRRFDDSPFFLPDFNEKDEKIKNIWFLIDTSGSISDKAIDAAYAEICSAIEQFNGKLEGILSFTEGYVTEPIPFGSIEELMAIKPIGGGGNDFSAIFRYMRNNMLDNLPSQIIIITDGYDTFPNESAAMGVPVLWLINNQDANPPWGKVARIEV